MASVLLAHENQGEDKHVESVLLPRSDTGSTPVSSTTKKKEYDSIESYSFFYRKFYLRLEREVFAWVAWHSVAKWVVLHRGRLSEWVSCERSILHCWFASHWSYCSWASYAECVD